MKDKDPKGQLEVKCSQYLLTVNPEEEYRLYTDLIKQGAGVLPYLVSGIIEYKDSHLANGVLTDEEIRIGLQPCVRRAAELVVGMVDYNFSPLSFLIRGRRPNSDLVNRFGSMYEKTPQMAWATSLILGEAMYLSTTDRAKYLKAPIAAAAKIAFDYTESLVGEKGTTDARLILQSFLSATAQFYGFIKAEGLITQMAQTAGVSSEQMEETIISKAYGFFASEL